MGKKGQKNRIQWCKPSLTGDTEYRRQNKKFLKNLRFLAKSAVLPTIDPSAALRACPELVEGTPVRAGPNGVDRVLGDKERRVMEIFLEYP